MIRLLSLLFLSLSLSSGSALAQNKASLAENDSAYDTLLIQHR